MSLSSFISLCASTNLFLALSDPSLPSLIEAYILSSYNDANSFVTKLNNFLSFKTLFAVFYIVLRKESSGDYYNFGSIVLLQSLIELVWTDLTNHIIKRSMSNKFSLVVKLQANKIASVAFIFVISRFNSFATFIMSSGTILSKCSCNLPFFIITILITSSSKYFLFILNVTKPFETI